MPYFFYYISLFIYWVLFEIYPINVTEYNSLEQVEFLTYFSP